MRGPRQGTIAGFDVVGELGRGAEGVVYRIRVDGDDYALKVHQGTNQEELAGFRRGAALLASVNHPALPKTYETGETGGHPYQVMDLLEGGELANLLTQGPLSQERVVRLALDLVGPLAALHRRGLVHRDLKPPNIMVKDGGCARLIDFGLAVGHDQDRSRTAVGTLTYASPEQTGMLSRPVDRRSDLYSLGVVLFECLTGEPPFTDKDTGDLLRRQATTAAPALGPLVPGLHPALAEAVARLLAKDPDDRYPSAELLAQDLVTVAVDLGVATDVDWPDSRPTEPPMVGRTREWGRLSNRWRDAAGAGRGGTVLLRGAGAMGKTRMLRELGTLAGDGGALVLHARGTADEGLPLAPLGAAVNDLLREINGLPEPQRSAAQERLRQAAGTGAALLAPLSGELAAVLGAPTGDPGGFAGTQFSAAVAGLLSGLARTWPGLLLCLDDLQWLDEATVDVVSLLAGTVHDVPLLIVVAARDDEEQAVERLRTAVGSTLDTEVQLRPLSPGATAELIQWQLPGIDVADRLGELLAERAGGNPLLARGYLSSIVEAGMLHPRWNRWQLDEQGLDGLDLPADAVDLVLARAGGLGTDARIVLAAAAAIGPSFSAAVVAAACPRVTDVAAVLVDAAQRHLVMPGSGDTYLFLHERVRSLVLEDLAPDALTALHHELGLVFARAAGPAPGASAEGSQSETVLAAAAHFLRGQPETAPAAAYPVLRAAGQLALARHAPADAVRFLQAACDLGDRDGTGTPDGDVLLQLGTALQRAGRYAEASAALERALDLHDVPVDRGRILALLADVHRSSWDTETARQAVKRGLAELGVAVPDRRAWRILTALAHFVPALVMLRTGIGRGSARESDRERLRLIATLHVLGIYIGLLGLRPSDVAVHTMLSLRPAVQVGDGYEFVRVVSGCGAAAAVAGLLRLSRFFIRFGRAEAVRLGDPRSLAVSAWYDGCSHYLSGMDDGESWAAALTEHGPYLDTGQYSDAVATLVTDACLEGRVGEMMPWYERGQRRVRTGNREEVTSMLTVEPSIQAAQGHAAQAGRSLVAIDALLVGRDARGLHMNHGLTSVMALLEQGDVGPRFDDAVARCRELSLSPRMMIRQHRAFYQAQIFGLLTRCRQAAPTERAAQLPNIRTALKDLRASVMTVSSRDVLTIATADLRILEGRPQAALQLLARMVPAPRFVPIAAFEAARVRARALIALGCIEEAHQYTGVAVALADEFGWPHRARWIAHEFGAAQRTPTLSRATPAGGSSIFAGADRQRLKALQEVSLAAARVLDPEDLARVVLDETVRILSAERALLFLGEDSREPGPAPDGPGSGPLVPRMGRDDQRRDLPELTGYSASLVERVRETRQPLVVTGTEEGAALGAQSVVLHDLRSIMIAPLEFDGRLHGVVYLDSRVAKGIFTHDDVDILAALSNQIAMAMETARTAQLELSVLAARRQRDLAEQLRSALEDMTLAGEPDDVLRRMLLHAGALLGAEQVCLIRTGADRRPSAQVPGQEPVGLTLDDQLRSLLTAQGPVSGAGEVPAALHDLLGSTSGWLAMPLRSRGQALGVLVATGEGAHHDTQVEVAATLAAQVGAVYQNAVLLAQLQELAVTDELTGIANRRHFRNLVARERSGPRRDLPFTVVMLDIDHFKQVNDTYGHPTGDDVIREVAARLAGTVRGGDVLARYGGEEFVLLLGPGDPCQQAERLRLAVGGEPIVTRTGPIPITVSVGVTVMAVDEVDLDSAVARADAALYRAKRAGRDRVELDPPPLTARPDSPA